ncbi:MAG: response regulator [Candidatus Lindowbacteria bacterium]|nr:response regulator [Candidatus Lindowbacteria bacterium]
MAGEKILVVDDDDLFAESFHAKLEQLGYDAHYVLSGDEAIEYVKDNEFDLVFTDLVMPGKNGVETCRGIKAVRPNLKICLVSGHPMEIEAHFMSFVDAGGIDVFLRKPFLHKLEEHVKKALVHVGYR